MDEICKDDYSKDVSTSTAAAEHTTSPSSLRNSSGSNVALEMSSDTRLTDLESGFTAINERMSDVTSKLDKLFTIMSTQTLNSLSSPKGGGG